MATVRVLFWVFCLGAIGWGRGVDRSVVGDGIASEATHPRNDGRRADCNEGRRADHNEGRRAHRNEGRGADRKGQGAAAVIRAAQKEIGVRETGPNTGQRIDQYGAYVGIKGLAWCAAFVSFVFREAGYPAPRTAWSPSLFPAKRQVKTPGAGSVMGLYYASLGRVGHCGIVIALRGDWYVTVEGNTSCGGWLATLSSRRARFVPRNDARNGDGVSRNGEREGDGVWRKMRHRKTIHCYADWLVKI